MSGREQGLQIEIVGDRLVISIGIDALMTAVRGGDDWDEDAVIVDSDAFAAEIARHLEDEAEDGTTKIHLAIDSASMMAVEMGCEAVRWPGDDNEA